MTNRFWWVNNKQTFEHEVGGGYIWSPKTNSNGGYNEFYENMRRVQPGDVVLSYAFGKIQAVGVAIGPALLSPKPDEFGKAGEAWQKEGWRIPVRFQRLTNPLRPKDHMGRLATTLPEKYSPIRATGDGNQGAYLAAVPQPMADTIIDLLGSQWGTLNLGLTDEGDALTLADELAERILADRPDLAETVKEQLVKARRGQGLFRQRVEALEKGCRVTGVADPRHLRASHIKPWRASDNTEKLDGDNGLLLSPHVDHLFDRGYISFADTGEMLVSSALDAKLFSLWGINSNKGFGPFRDAQKPYLTFHRESVFKS